jgi:hypothetical protein
VAKNASAALGIGMIATGVALTIASGTIGQQDAHASFGGAGSTVTRSAAPTTIDTPSAAPTLKANPFTGGFGNGHG